MARRSRIPLPGVILGLTAVVLGALPSAAQLPADPVLDGLVQLDGQPLPGAMVVLHHVSSDTQGEVDSLVSRPDGSWALSLPRVPDPARGDVFFASVQHDGIRYFGPWITQPIQLDSSYLIQAFDTAMAPRGGTELTIDLRATFLEPSGDGWEVTDVFDVRNGGRHTLVPHDDGVVWSHPLPAGARDFEGGVAEPEGAVALEEGALVLRTPVSPGPRRIAVRYIVDEALPTFPTPSEIGFFELFVREPAPLLEVDGMIRSEPVEVSGSTYRHYSAEGYAGREARIEAGDGPSRLPVEWMAVALALALAGVGVFTMKSVGTVSAGSAAAGVAPAPAAGSSRAAVLLEIARLDEEFEQKPEPSDADRVAYQEARTRLLRRAQGS